MKDLIMSKYISSRLSNTSYISHVSHTMKLIVILTLMLFVRPCFAEQNDVAKQQSITASLTYSSGQLANDIKRKSTNQIITQLKERIIVADSDQVHNKALTLTRDELMKQKQQTPPPPSKSTSNERAQLSKENASKSLSYGSFVIYQGHAQLIEDLDIDGFYQTFSVTFDADFISYSPHDKAIVYAELYLSENGGPWQHYYTTDSFIIQGESTEDTFEVYSTLSQGFNPSHYDILIDLYQDGSSNIAASYSSNDSNALFALPLESSDYDREYYQEIYVYGGTLSITSLAMIFFLLAIRKLRLVNKEI